MSPPRVRNLINDNITPSTDIGGGPAYGFYQNKVRPMSISAEEELADLATKQTDLGNHQFATEVSIELAHRKCRTSPTNSRQHAANQFSHVRNKP